MKTLSEVRRAVQRDEFSWAAVVNEALERAQDPTGEGPRVFLRVSEEAAKSAARAADEARARRLPSLPLSGLPVSVKDLFDAAGEVTLAGSKVRADAAPAQNDSAIVRRLREAGAAIIGRTNMTEFAYSGLGLNPHYGTPLNPYDRAGRRIPGGSSSGAAVSVSDGMALVAVATDTGGSARIPAAFCGLTGFKPTASRIPMDGAFPLAPSLDSVGMIGPSVDCCAELDAVLAGDTSPLPAPVDTRGIRIGVVTDYVTQDLDAVVARTYEAALDRLSAAGVEIVEARYPELFELSAYNRRGGFPAFESYRVHAQQIEARGDEYDPRVAARIRRGQTLREQDHALLQAQREAFIRASTPRFQGLDALVAPTVPIVAPRLPDCESDEEFSRLNLLVLRNPTLVNFLDGCAISIPCHRPGDAPVGLMLFQTSHQDRRLIALARVVERLLNR